MSNFNSNPIISPLSQTNCIYPPKADSTNPPLLNATKKPVIVDNLDVILRAIKNSETLTPFPMPTFISYAWETFRNFIYKLLGVKPSATNEELKLQLAMHLFKSFEASILPSGLSSESKEQLPLSVALEAYYHTIKNYPDHFGASYDKVEALGQCVEYSKILESLKNYGPTLRNLRLKLLKGQIAKRISHLKVDETIYLPGGFAEYRKNEDHAESDVSEQLKQSFEVTPMIYEIRRDPKNSTKLIFRMINNTGYGDDLIKKNTPMNSNWGISFLQNLNNPLKDNLNLNHENPFLNITEVSYVTEFNIPTTEFLENLHTLLEVQAVPYSSYNINWIEGIYYSFLDLINGIVSAKKADSTSSKVVLVNEKKNPNSNLIINSLPIVKDLSIVKFNNIFKNIRHYSIKKKISDFKIKPKKNPSALSIVNLFSTTFLKNREEDRKLVLKVALFLDVYKICLPRMAEKKVRLWIKDSLQSLMNDLEKKLVKSSNISKVINYFSAISAKINEMEVPSSFSLPPGPNQQPSHPQEFKDPLFFKDNNYSLNLLNITPADSITLEEIKPPALNLISDLDFLFINKLDTCEILSQSKNLEELQYHVREGFEILQKIDKTNFWDNLELNALGQWSHYIHQLSGYLCQSHFGLDLPGPTSLQILNILQAINLCLKLAKKNDRQTHFGSMGLLMTEFKDILKDDYLNLMTEGPEIHKTIKEIEEGSVRLDLTNANSLEHQQPKDQKFFSDYLDKYKKELKGYKNIQEDFTPGKGKLNSQIIHLRRLKIMALALMARYRTLGNPSHFEALKNSLTIFVNSFINTQENLEADYIKKICQDIDKALHNPEVPGDFTATSYFLKEGKTVHLKPYGELGYHNYFNSSLDQLVSAYPSKNIKSQYKNTEEPVPESIAKVIESCVSNCEGAIVNETGFPVPLNYRTHHVPSGECHTERYIFEDSTIELGLPPDIWALIRMTKTAPLGTRIPNTLDVFCKYPNYLGSWKFSLSMQRIFNLNLFRNNGLANYLILHPEYTKTLVSQLVTLFAELNGTQNIEGTLFIMYLTSTICHILRKLIKDTHGTVHEYNDEIASLINLQSEKQYPVLEQWVQDCEIKSHLKSYARRIYQTFLLVNEESSFETSPLTLLKVWFKMHQIPQTEEAYNYLHKNRIDHMLHKLLPAIETQFANPLTTKTFLNELANELGLKLNIDGWKRTKISFSFQNGEFSLNLKKGLLFKKGVATCRLPDMIIQNPLCRAIFDENNIAGIWCNYKSVSIQNNEGACCEFIYKDQKFAILLLKDSEPLIYKQVKRCGCSTPQWFQYSEIGITKQKNNDLMPLLKQTFQKLQEAEPATSSLPSIHQTLPETILKNRLWVSCQSNHFFVESVNHQLLFEGEFKDQIIKKNINNLKHVKKEIKWIVNSTKENSAALLNPWADKSFAHFLALSPSSKIIASSDGYNKVNHIYYINHAIEYKWCEQTQNWKCKNHPEFYLSNKKIESVLFFHNSENINRNFFAAQFCYYHILEHPTKQPKLILPCQEYKKISSPIAKHNRNFQPGKLSELKKTFYDYAIEPYEGLKSSTPDGYLYLAYVLFTQSQYEQAYFYLKKAQHIKPETSKECQQILNWFSKWKLSSLNAKVFMLHVHLLTLEQSPSIKKSTNFSSSQKTLLINFLNMCRQYDFTKPHPCLRLNETAYAHMCEYIQLITDHVCDFERLGSDGIVNEIAEKLGLGLAEIKTSLQIHPSGLNPKEIELLRLEEGKENLQKSMDLSGSQEFKVQTFIDKETPLFPWVNQYLQQVALNRIPKGSLDNLLKELQDKFKKPLTFAEKIAEELVKDIYVARSQFDSQSYYIEENDRQKLETHINESINSLTDSANKLRQAILSCIYRPYKQSPWQTFEHNSANSWESNSGAFNEILHAAATNELSGENFKYYYKVKLKGNTSIYDLDQSIRLYLENMTSLQQCLKAKDLIYHYNKTQSPTLKNALVELLLTQRQYDTKSDPYAIAMLLLESEQKIIARKSQVDHFRTMISKTNIFKHEALAGGKTTFLRNLISKIKADRINLSCIITHEPLKPLHHQQLEQATSESYGDKVYEFVFNRDHPSDALTLRTLRNNLLTYITQNGRLDFTPRDILSLHHTMILKQEELASSARKRDLNIINEEIAILSEIITIILTKGCASSDEFDKMMEAYRQHNYGLGEPNKLDKNKCDAASSLVEWILSIPEYASIFQKSDTELWKYAKNKKFIATFINTMAETVVRLYLPSLNDEEKKLAINYLADRKNQSNAAIQNFRQSKINALEPNLKLTIKTFHKLFHKIIPNSFQKRNGLHYIRSKDGSQVKPVISNGTCSELSEFGTEEETLWYTCLNYMNCKNKKAVGGVTETQIAQLILKLKNESAEVIARQLKENPHEYVVFNQTESAKKFKLNFQIELESITQEHYGIIANRVNKTPKLLAEFLNQYVFPIPDHRSEQIEGTPQHLVAMFKEFSGSSGTSNIWRSLPDKIIVDPNEVKQPGVDGNVFLNLFLTFSSSDLIKYNDQGNIPKQIASCLKSLDCGVLIDCAPVFPGLVAEKITESLTPYMEQNALIRFTNEKNKEVVFDNIKKTIVVDNSGYIDKAFVIIDNAQTRGTHKEMSYQSTGLLTINKLTTLTEFSQSLMRMRKFGKGQKIKLCVDPKTYNYLVKKENTNKGNKKEKIKNRILLNLINLLCKNESEFLKNQHHLKTEIQKIQAVGENVIFNNLLEILDLETRIEIWKKCRHFFIKPSQDTLETLDEARKQSSLEGLKELAKAEKDKLKAFKQDLLTLDFNCRDSFINSLNICINGLKLKARGMNLLAPEYLPTHYYVTSNNLNMNNYVQKEQNIKTDRQIEEELELEKDQENLPKPIIEYPWQNLWQENDTPSLATLLNKIKTTHINSSIQPLNKYAKFYDHNLFYTYNLFKPIFNPYEAPTENNLILTWTDFYSDKPFPPGQTRFLKIAIIVDKQVEPHQVYGIFGSDKDFDHVFSHLQSEKQPHIDFYNYSLISDILIGGDWHKDYSPQIQKEIGRIIIQAKHLTGVVELKNPPKGSKNENINSQYILFKDWLNEIFKKNLVNIVNLEKNLKKYLRKFHPSITYESSLMAKAYETCKNKGSNALRESHEKKKV